MQHKLACLNCPRLSQYKFLVTPLIFDYFQIFLRLNSIGVHTVGNSRIIVPELSRSLGGCSSREKRQLENLSRYYREKKQVWYAHHQCQPVTSRYSNSKPRNKYPTQCFPKGVHTLTQIRDFGLILHPTMWFECFERAGAEFQIRKLLKRCQSPYLQDKAQVLSLTTKVIAPYNDVARQRVEINLWIAQFAVMVIIE